METDATCNWKTSFGKNNTIVNGPDETFPLNACARIGVAEQRVNKMFIVQS